jgi:hypothetical protein
VLIFLLGVQCSVFQNGDKKYSCHGAHSRAAVLHDYAISFDSFISSIIRSVPNCFLISALLILFLTNKVWFLWGIIVQVFGVTNFFGRRSSGNLSVGAKLWDTTCCYELILLAEDRRNIGTFVNTMMNLGVP